MSKVLSLVGAKDFRPDADKGAALGNGDGVIVGHPPGALVEVGRGGEEGGLGAEEKLVGGVEVGTDAGFIVCIRCHAHHTRDLRVGTVAPFARLQELPCFVGSKTVFCFLCRHMKLEQAGDNPAVFLRLSVNFGKEFRSVYGMNEADERSNVFDFVGLEVADEMPLNVLW